jgi:hypothetical protein
MQLLIAPFLTPEYKKPVIILPYEATRELSLLDRANFGGIFINHESQLYTDRPRFCYPLGEP